jgi:uncharacterized protein with HEPN domain
VSRRDDERVADILDAADEISEIVALGRDAWDKDRIRQLAAERLLEIIGEAANTLTEDFRAQHPGVPWRDIIGLRIVLAHHYHRVDPGQVWVIAATEVPRLAQSLRPRGQNAGDRSPNLLRRSRPS